MQSLLLIAILFVTRLRAERVESFSESDVLAFVDQASKNEEISRDCVRSLRMIVPFLNSNLTLEQQRSFFHASYASGEAYQFISRDMDRWFFRSYECQKAAGQTAFSTSEYPVSYCYSMSEKTPNKVYGICIPTPCEPDRRKV
jgi:hypothetical protein